MYNITTKQSVEINRNSIIKLLILKSTLLQQKSKTILTQLKTKLQEILNKMCDSMISMIFKIFCSRCEYLLYLHCVNKLTRTSDTVFIIILILHLGSLFCFLFREWHALVRLATKPSIRQYDTSSNVLFLGFNFTRFRRKVY